MPNTWTDAVWFWVFALVLMLAMAPLLFGLAAIFDESWLTGASADFDDDLRVELFPITHTLMPQGPVVNRIFALLIVLPIIPFHPPA